MRESLMRRSAIFHVCLGAAELNPEAQDKPQYEYVKLLKTIIDLGARVNAQDVTGYSALHHLMDKTHVKTVLTMTRVLLENGADPNLRNRFGFVPLRIGVNQGTPAAVKLLLEFGADPSIKDNDGSSPLQLSTQFPEMQAIFTAFYKKEVKKERKVAKRTVDFKKCEGCKSPAEKRCTGFLKYSIYYHIWQLFI